MTLTAKDVEEITRLLEESSFDELYLELEGVKLSLRRGAGASSQSNAARPLASNEHSPSPAPPVSSTEPSSSGTAGGPRAASGAPSARSRTRNDAQHDVAAPLLGTFYRAPKPGAPAFIEVGALVEEETIIGIIEVMKLMNTVRAGARGRVTEILARDGVLVEYGQTLIRIERPSTA